MSEKEIVSENPLPKKVGGISSQEYNQLNLPDQAFEGGKEARDRLLESLRAKYRELNDPVALVQLDKFDNNSQLFKQYLIIKDITIKLISLIDQSFRNDPLQEPKRTEALKLCQAFLEQIQAIKEMIKQLAPTPEQYQKIAKEIGIETYLNCQNAEEILNDFMKPRSLK